MSHFKKPKGGEKAIPTVVSIISLEKVWKEEEKKIVIFLSIAFIYAILRN